MTLSLSRSLDIRSTIDNAGDPLLEKSPKKFRSTNTWLETKKLQNALEGSKAMLEEKRVEKLAQLSQAEWIPSCHLVKVTRNVGRHWATMGHSYCGELYLYPEEALFLLEANTIEIYHGGIPMSLQQAYSVLLGNGTGCSLDEYRAFAHLTRFGYKVRRHTPEVDEKQLRGEPLEVDVVGVIRKRKSSETESRGNVVEVEDAVEVVDCSKGSATCSDKNPPLDNHLPSTSQVNSAPSADDDDIKFLEFVDTSKKRKVLSSVIINDDIEITVTSNCERDNMPSGQSANPSSVESKELCRKESKSVKVEAEKMSSKSLQSAPDSELELVKGSNDRSLPSRGMYKNNVFELVSSSSKHSECTSSMNNPSMPKNSCNGEGKSASNDGNKDLPETCIDDVIVLSDDETKEDDKHAKELTRFYKEISLIELIDISEEDEVGKAVNNTGAAGGNNKKLDEMYDFWGVLGRIPSLEKGRLTMRIPAPPPELIPLNIQPFKGEYEVSVMTSMERPSENTVARRGNSGTMNHTEAEAHGVPHGERHGDRSKTAFEHFHEQNRPFHSRQRPEEPWMRSQGSNRSNERNASEPHQRHEGNFSHWSQPSMKNPWNSWTGNYYHHMNHYSYSLQANYPGNQYQTNSGRSLWSSLVYPDRQVGAYPMPNTFHTWLPPNSPHFHHSAQQWNSQGHGQSMGGQYWPENRSHQWQHNSYHSYGQRSGARWQQSGARSKRGNGHYGRSGRCLLPLPRRGMSQGSRDLTRDTYAASVVPKVPQAQNWSELKTKSEKSKSLEMSEELKPAFNKEDSKNILPLIKPADSISIDSVQSKLQITSSGQNNFYNALENYSSSFSIKFDLYMPNCNFRKSSPGLPKYRLCIVKSEDKIPKLKDTWYLTKDLNDEVPLLFAVSFTENVNFFSFSNVELPAPVPP